MKILLLTVLIATSFGAINVACLKELTKLGIDVAKTAAAFSSGNIPGGIINLIKDIKELQTVISVCKQSEIEEFVSLSTNVGDCIKESFAVVAKSRSAISDYKENGLTPAFTHDVEQITLEVYPLVAACQSQDKADQLAAIFPTECIAAFEKFAQDALAAVADQNKPVALVKDLIALLGDYKSAKKACPFLGEI